MRCWGMAASLSALLSCGGSAYAQETQIYTYDVHGRLGAVHRDKASGSLVTVYGLDSANNRSERTNGRTMIAEWEAEALAHSTGYLEVDGRAGDTNQREGFLNGGPYTPNVPVGDHVAVWRILIDTPQDSNPATVVRLDVWDINAGRSLAFVLLPQSAWRAAWTYQYFELPFTVGADEAGHELEFRTYFFPIAHVRVDKVGYR